MYKYNKGIDILCRNKFPSVHVDSAEPLAGLLRLRSVELAVIVFLLYASLRPAQSLIGSRDDLRFQIYIKTK